jgi:hypothetical protein
LPTTAYDDPYTKDFYNKKLRALRIEPDRANSYLPYSHHQRDPNQKPADIYIEDEALHSSTLGVGSMLQDNYIDHGEPIKDEAPAQRGGDEEKVEPLPAMTKRKKKRRCCGLRYRTIAFLCLLFIAIIIVIWYFVWPRIPILSLDDIDVEEQTRIPTKSAQKSISATWLVNMSADNSVNWVPTRISNWDVTVIDDATQKQFGNGSTGPFVLPPRKSSIVNFEMKIFYETDNENDTTFQDLYNACALQVKSSMGDNQNKQNLLNATFYITHHISGIVWTQTTSIQASSMICPN